MLGPSINNQYVVARGGVFEPIVGLIARFVIPARLRSFLLAVRGRGHQEDAP